MSVTKYSQAPAINEQDLTSQKIAEATGKFHKHVMRDIRNMEAAWVKVNETKFGLVNYIDKKNEMRTMYRFTPEEFLFVISGYDHVTRAKLTKLAFANLEEQKQARPDGLDLIREEIRKNSREIQNLNRRKNRLKAKNDKLSSTLRMLDSSYYERLEGFQFSSSKQVGR